MIRRWTLLAMALVLGIASGCGDGRPARVPVAGRVLVDGKPLTEGRNRHIRFVPDDNRPAQGTIGEGGRFRLFTWDPQRPDGCIPGRHRVEIIASDTISPTEIKWLVPLRYRRAETSDLTVVIDKPTEDLEINVTWGGEQPTIEKSTSEGDSDPNRL